MLVYRCPIDGDKGINAAERLCSIMSHYTNHSGPTFILGDLNCPDIKWNFSRQPTSRYQLPIYEFCQRNAFSQFVPEATRGANLLDVLCTDEPILVSSISVQPPFPGSDHDSVNFELLFQDIDVDDDALRQPDNCCRHPVNRRYIWSQGDFTAMSEFLSATDWSHLFSYNLTPDAIWTAFCHRLDEAVELFVPSVETSERKSARVRQYPRHIRRLMSRRLAVWRRYKTNRSDETLRSRYKKLTDDYCDAVRRKA